VWVNPNNRQLFNDRQAVALKDASEAVTAGSEQVGAEKIAKLYQDKFGKNYYTGKQLKELDNWPASWNADYKDNQIYEFNTTAGNEGEEYKKRPVGVEINELLELKNETGVYNYIMSHLWADSYDGDDLYYFGTEEGRLQMDNNASSLGIN